jgi:hypothetical protein
MATHEAGGYQRWDQELFVHCAIMPLKPLFSEYHSKKPVQVDRNEHPSQVDKYFCFQSEIEATQNRRYSDGTEQSGKL